MSALLFCGRVIAREQQLAKHAGSDQAIPGKKTETTDNPTVKENAMVYQISATARG